MKSLMSLVKEILFEIGDLALASTTDDYKTVVRRVNHEGISFLTISLSNFSKDLLKGLDQKFIDPSMFASFGKLGASPRFLGGLLDLVFDRATGVLLDDPSIDAISGIYQFTSMFSKIEIDCTEDRVRAAYAAYIKCEQDIKLHDVDFTGELRKKFSVTSSILFSKVFNEVNRLIDDDLIIPKHGPGATAERLSSNKKYNGMTWTSRLEKVFPHSLWMYPNYQAALDEPFGRVDILEPGAELPVRVVDVPKTLKTPRIIAIEPACMQFMQQAISRAITPLIESDNLIGSMIGFVDQGPNQDLAREGSLSGELATLDLSEASDRISNQHVLELFRPWRSLNEAIQATRSRKADVPYHGIIRLAKYASMGSALTFPVEAMVFLTVVFMAIAEELSTPVTAKLVSQFRGKVRVYGDDIIVPRRFANTVARTLELLGYKVNTNKSFWTGKFRESCGGDYYDGARITPIKLRRVLPRQLTHTEEIVSFSSFRNQLYKAGYWRTVKWCDAYLDVVLCGVYPPLEDTADAVGRHTFLPVYGTKMCPSLHRPMVPAYSKKDKLRDDNLEGYGALMKFFLKKGENPINGRHLIYAGRPLKSRLKRGMAYTY